MSEQVKRELIFSTLVPSKENKDDDALVIKEVLHGPDGLRKSNLRVIPNYQRPYWLTKPEYRDHNDKKEWEHSIKLDKYTTNQRRLANEIFYKLNGFYSNQYVRLTDVTASQYVYGADISPNVLIAHEYKTRFPNLFTPSTLAVMDYEWDVKDGHGRILCGAIAMGNKLHIGMTREFIGNLEPYVEQRVLEGLHTHFYDFLKERNITPKITISDTPGRLVLSLLKSAHDWRPDFLGFWNMAGDINKMLEMLRAENIDPAFAFSDPSIDKKYRYFNWRQDKIIKTKSNGDTTRKHHADLWHVVTAPSSFYCVCLMAAHKHCRAREQNRNSYALDGILEEYIGEKKFDAPGVPKMNHNVDWHKMMQSDYKIEYLIYLGQDVVGPIKLDEKTKDISHSLRRDSDISELAKIKSNPTTLSDDLYFSYAEKNKIIGSTSADMRTPLDNETPSVKNWIVTVPSYLTHGMGGNFIEEYPKLETNIVAYVADVDASGAYPTSEICLNVSKNTRAFEVCSIEGLTTTMQRAVGINMTSVDMNCIMLANELFGLPTIPELEENFIKYLEEK